MLVLTCFAISGLLYFAFVDTREIRKLSVFDKSRQRKQLRKVYDFFGILLPDEFSSEPWLIRLWRKLWVEHEYFCVLMPYQRDRKMR